MRILEIIASVDPAGGGPIEGLVRQDAACRAIGLPVTREIATLDTPDAACVAACPMTVHALGRDRNVSRHPWRRLMDRWGYAPDFIPWLRANVGRYDAVIVNGLWNYSSFAASRVLPGGPVPYFVFPHGMLSDWFRRNRPLKHLLKQAFWLISEGRLLAGARAALFTCEEERLQARGQFFGHRYKPYVVGYGTERPPVSTPDQTALFRSIAPRLGERPYLLFLARIHPIKGCELLVRAFARTKDIRTDIDLVIAGPDSLGLRSRLEHLAQQLNIQDRIHWTGPLYGPQKWGALHAAEAFLLPSHLESFGIAIVESLGCGRPVLISDKVNIWREVHERDAGLVENDTVEGVTRMLTKWFLMRPEDRAAMGPAAIKLFNDSFDIRTIAPKTMDTLTSLSRPV